jgi:phenylpropionate dioxygenase-like ring-hydroxylating dioxygenase large terminal subunit
LHDRSDPSHLPFAHHKIISHRSQAAFIDIEVDDIHKGGFDSGEFYPQKPTNGRGPIVKTDTVKVAQSLHFRPPNLLFQRINMTEVWFKS